VEDPELERLLLKKKEVKNHLFSSKNNVRRKQSMSNCKNSIINAKNRWREKKNCNAYKIKKEF